MNEFCDLVSNARSFNARILMSAKFADYRNWEFIRKTECFIAVERPARVCYRQLQALTGIYVWNDGEQITVKIAPSDGSTTRRAPEQAYQIMNERYLGKEGLSTVRSTVRFVDLLLACTPREHLTSKYSEIGYHGIDLVDSEKMHHVTMECDEYLLDCWLTTGERPLLRKVLAKTKAKAKPSVNGEVQLLTFHEFDDWKIDERIAPETFQAPQALLESKPSW